MADKLLLCPFCGEKAELRKEEYGFYVVCPSCLCETQTYSTDDDAIITWNNRPSPWHTGTPTEEGYYLVEVKEVAKFYNTHSVCYFDGEKFQTIWTVIAWQKIEPYKEED